MGDACRLDGGEEARSVQHMSKVRQRVPEHYLEDDMERVNRLTERLKEAEVDLKVVDEIHEEVVYRVDDTRFG